MTRRTKIVATLGPACDERRRSSALLRAGVDVVRLNLSHGSLEEHLARLAIGARRGRRARSPDRRAGRPARAEDPGRALPRGRRGARRRALREAAARRPDEQRRDDHGRLSDAARRPARRRPADPRRRCDQPAHGRRRSRRGGGADRDRRPHAGPSRACTCRPNGCGSTSPTDEDLVLAERMAAAGRRVHRRLVRARRRRHARRCATVVGDRAELVAKIETTAALANLGEILDESDAIMVARGDLGIDCPLEDVPHLQKTIIRQCVEFGVPVITATQMLESMVDGAVADAGRGDRRRQRDLRRHRRADALRRDGDRSRPGAGGDHDGAASPSVPRVEAQLPRSGRRGSGASNANAGTRSTTRSRPPSRTPPRRPPTTWAPTAILCCTSRGRTAKAMARFRPEARLLGAVAQPAHASTRSTLSWGVEPVLVDTYDVDRRDGLVRRRTLGPGRADRHRRRRGGARRLAGAAAVDRRRRAARSCASNDEPRPIWATTIGRPPARRPHVVLVHGSLDRSAGMLKLSRRLDERSG